MHRPLNLINFKNYGSAAILDELEELHRLMSLR